MISQFISNANLSIRVVENTKFRSLQEFLNPASSCLMPGRDATSSRISACMKKKAELIERLSNLESRISTTTDTWTSTNGRAFMAVTVDSIDKNWICCDVLLDIIYLDDLKHSGEVMAMKLDDCLLAYCIKKIMILVSDNASSKYKLSTFKTFFQIFILTSTTSAASITFSILLSRMV